jgi:HAD superfamily hydrolase (TIGR01509 family)
MKPRLVPTPKREHEPVRGVIFDYGNTLVRLDPKLHSARTDYADVVACPGAERLRSFLVQAGVLTGLAADAFVERFLEVRERNRTLAEQGGREIPALESLRETLRELEAPSRDGVDLESGLRSFFLTEVELMRPMPGARELLDDLRGRGIRIAMLSNATSGPTIAHVVDRMGWSGYFDPLVVSADIGVRKPRPDAFRAVLDRWDLDPTTVAMVGDSLYHDVGGALALGLLAIHLAAIPNPFDAAVAGTIRPTFSVTTLEELRPLLL